MYLVSALDHGCKIVLGGADGAVLQQLHQPLPCFRQPRLKRPLHRHLQAAILRTPVMACGHNASRVAVLGVGWKVIPGGVGCAVLQQLDQTLPTFRQSRLKTAAPPLAMANHPDTGAKLVLPVFPMHMRPRHQAELTRVAMQRLKLSAPPEVALSTIWLLAQEAEERLQVRHMAGGRAGRGRSCKVVMILA